MKQTSEAFGKAMMELDEKQSPPSFAEQIAKIEQQMNERIEQMQNNILSSIAEAQKQTPTAQETEVTEVTEVTEGTEDTEGVEENTEE